MIFTKDVKNLKIYKRQMYLPTLENDRTSPNKKTNSAIFLLTPNRRSSVALMQHPLLVNKLRYSSYYIERDIMYFIDSKYMSEDESLDEAYLYEDTTDQSPVQYTGFAPDVEKIKSIFTVEDFNNILQDLGIDHRVTLVLEVGDFPGIDEYFEFSVANIDDRTVVRVHVPRHNLSEGLEMYSRRILNFVYKAIYIAFHQDEYETNNASIVADTYTDADTSFNGRDLEKIIRNEAKSAPITMDNLAKKFRYATTSKFKRQYSKKLNTLKRNMDQISDSMKVSLNIPTVGSTASSKTSESVYTKNLENLLIRLDEGADYMRFGASTIAFSEASYAKYDMQLKRMLFKDRIKKRKTILDLDDQMKAEIPDIKFAYPELGRYNKKNLFVDLYYYNQSFFKNNTWKMKRGFDLYLDLLDRIINDNRITEAGYRKKTIFIPIMDWTNNPNTRMWLYKETINPMSIIYELMLKDPQKIKKVFGDKDVFFFAKDKYFKLNFMDIATPREMKAASNKFRVFIQKIVANSDFEPEDLDSDVSNSPDAVKTAIYDKIEVAKGVDLTGKEKASKADLEALAKHNPKVAAKNLPFDTSVISKNNSAVDAKTSGEKELEKEEKDGEVTASVDKLKQLEREDDLQRLASKIDHLSTDAVDAEEVLNKMDNDQDIKELIMALDKSNNDSIDISATRAARINKLSDDLMTKEINGVSVKDLLSTKSNKQTIKTSSLPVNSVSDSWHNMTYMNFDKNYNIDKDIVACFNHFATVSMPFAIRDITVEDTSTSEDRIETYNVKIEDFRDKNNRQTIKLDIPIIEDNRFLLRGNAKVISTQFLNMPVLKTDLDTAQIITNYQKIFIRRFRTSTGRSNPIASSLIKALQKYKGRDLKISFGDNSRISNSYQLPIDYIDISGVINSIEYPEKNIKIYFSQKEIHNDYPNINDAKGVPYMVNTKTKAITYYNDMHEFFASKVVDALSSSKGFMELYSTTKPTMSGTYTRCSILNCEIPLVVIAGYVDGLDKLLKRAGIEFHWQESINNEIRQDPLLATIRFKDGYLVYRISYSACLLLNGLKDCGTENYSMADMNSKYTYIEFLDNFGGRVKADGIENFNDCLVDPISKEIMEHYKMPTDFVGLLLYVNTLLADNKYIRHTDTSSRRIRRAELVAAYVYEALTESYAIWTRQIRHGRKNVKFIIKQSAVIDKILQSPISQDDSINNALGAVEATNAISYKGKSGLNNDRSYSLDKRGFDETMLNVMGCSTTFSSSAGITRIATMNMNVDGPRGFIKQINSDTSKMDSVNTLSATEAMIPFEATHDDNPRVLMSFVQTAKHQVRVNKSDPLLVTSGVDEALPYLTTDKFAYKAKDKGKVLSISEKGMVIQYSNNKKEYISFEDTIEKNSDGGYYVPMKLQPNKGLKAGSTFKDGEVLAYDPASFSNSLGEDDNIAYNAGTLAKVAIINSDEGYEDSGVCTKKLSNELITQVIYKFEHVIEKDAIIYRTPEIGKYVNVGDPLLVWQDPFEDSDANSILRVMGKDTEISDLGRRKIESETTGTIVGVKVYRTCELADMSESVRKFVSAYEKPIKALKKELEAQGIDTKTMPATYALPTTGKLKKAEDAIYVEVYVQHQDVPGIGDKITYFAANKAVLRSIIPEGKEPYTDFRPNEEVSAMLSVSSINKRMVTSILMNGSLNKLMIELDRSVKDILGISYDESEL